MRLDVEVNLGTDSWKGRSEARCEEEQHPWQPGAGDKGTPVFGAGKSGQGERDKLKSSMSKRCLGSSVLYTKSHIPKI